MKLFSRAQVNNWLHANVGSLYQTYGYKGESLGYQCPGLTTAYSKYLGLPKISAYYARDMYNNADPRYYTRIKNTPTFIPLLGDIAVFDNHVSIVRDANILSFVSLDQNWLNSGPMGSPGAFCRHNYLKPRMMGFLRPVNVVDTEHQANHPPQAPVTAPIPQDDSTYIIKKGDTFWALERAWGMQNGRLTALNPTLNPRKLRIGQSIRRK